MELIEELKQKEIVKHGHFLLKSGQQSDYYFDFKLLISYPALLTKVTKQLCNFIITPTTLVGVPQAGTIFATTMCHMMQLPMLFIRSSQKTYGTQKEIEGVISNTVILIEDVITTGSSIIDAIKLLNKYNISVTQIIAILDRQMGGKQTLEKLGYHVTTMYEFDQFV